MNPPSRRLRPSLPRLAVALAVALAPLPAAAHAFLATANPRVGSTIAAAPPQLLLNFTEGVEPDLSSVAVTNAAGAVVSIGHCHTAGRADRLAIALGKLPPGAYTVTWHAVAIDLHKTEGHFVFHVRK